MDFKVCGTNDGVTAIQMDIKIMGLSKAIMTEALAQARDGRLHVISKMNEVIAQPRADLSQYAPRITTIKVKPDHIRLIIGPGGKMIKAIVDETGCAINVEDDGTVAIASSDPAAVKRAIEIIETLTIEPEVGKKYKGIVRRVEAYGAFLEIAPGNDGLLHISDFDWKRVEKVEDVMNLGDEVEVVVTNIDRDGKIRLSRKDLLPKPEGWEERPPRERGDRDRDRNGRGGRRDGRDRDRGPRRDRGERSESRDFDRDDRGPRRRRGRDDRRDDRPEERSADSDRRDHDDREDRPERVADDRRDRDDRSEGRRDRHDRAEGRSEGRRDRDDRAEGRRDRDDRRDDRPEVRRERSEGRRDDRSEGRRDDREGRRDDREGRRDDREGRRDSSERVERSERRDDRRDDRSEGRRDRDDDREHRSQDKPEPSVD
jgi:polyribonucleotide nucleotidyltransferase